MRILGVIPARMAAVRFPGKPLADMAGKPLVEWVYRAARGCDDLDDLVVATPDADIALAVEGFGGRAVLTGDHHATGTDRVAEVAARHGDADVVVNIQGDQPFVTPAMLSALVAPYRDAVPPPMTTLGAPLGDGDASPDPNLVKVVCDRRGEALYFSRSPIPYLRHGGLAGLPVYHHLGLYAFTREFLAEYATMAPTPLEMAEGLEQLRVLEHGFRIRVCVTPEAVPEVNTPEDLDQAVALLESRRGA